MGLATSGTSDSRDRLRGPLEEALTRYARVRASRDERGGEPPRPGDVFVFTATAELAVLWVVTEHDPDNDRFLALPADSNLLIGSADVAVPAEARGGALSLRCAFGLWLDARDFAGAKRTGCVDPEILERVRQKRAEIKDGKPTASLIEHETAAELEYRDWMEEIRYAELKLFKQLRRREAAAFSGAGEARSPGGRSRWGSFVKPLSMAASVLFVVSLGLAAGMLWQRQEIAARVNVPVVLLDRGAAMRGETKVVTVSSEAGSLVLILDIDESHPDYRLEIRRQDTDEAVWSSDELTKRIEGLTVFLPLAVVPPGEYQLELYGLRDGQPRPLEEYMLTIESESAPE